MTNRGILTGGSGLGVKQLVAQDTGALKITSAVGRAPRCCARCRQAVEAPPPALTDRAHFHPVFIAGAAFGRWTVLRAARRPRGAASARGRPTTPGWPRARRREGAGRRSRPRGAAWSEPRRRAGRRGRPGVAELRSAHERLKGEFAELSGVGPARHRDDFLKLAEQSFAQSTTSRPETSRSPTGDRLPGQAAARIARQGRRQDRGGSSSAASGAYGDSGASWSPLASIQVRMNSRRREALDRAQHDATAGTWGESSCGGWSSSPDGRHCDFAEQPSSGTTRDAAARPGRFGCPGNIRIVVDAKAPTERTARPPPEGDPTSGSPRLKCTPPRSAAMSRRSPAATTGPVSSRRPSRRPFLPATPSSRPPSIDPGDNGPGDRPEGPPRHADEPVALSRAVAYGWKQEAFRGARRKWSKSAASSTTGMASVSRASGARGAGLASAVQNYNKAVGSFEQKPDTGRAKV